MQLALSGARLALLFGCFPSARQWLHDERVIAFKRNTLCTAIPTDASFRVPQKKKRRVCSQFDSPIVQRGLSGSCGRGHSRFRSNGSSRTVNTTALRSKRTCQQLLKPPRPQSRALSAESSLEDIVIAATFTATGPGKVHSWGGSPRPFFFFEAKVLGSEFHFLKNSDLLVFSRKQVDRTVFLNAS